MKEIIHWLNSIVWSPALVIFILGLGFLFTIKTKFVQFKYIKEMIKLTFSGSKSTAGISSFQAMSMSLGSRIGIGNIAGVATAITLGGPGAIFWMWILAFISASIAFAETTLAQIYKVKQNGEYRGGAPYYINKGLNKKGLALLFAGITMISMTLLVPGIQVNTIALSMDQAFGLQPSITAIILVILLATIIFGGVKRIARAAEMVVPIMAIGYISICIIILLVNITSIPSVVGIIINSAINPTSTFGGIIGSAISWGVQRGAFSNAAGFGSETFETAASEVSHPVKQGLVQALSVYITTIIICSATAFMILITGMYNIQLENGTIVKDNIGNVEAGASNVQMSIETLFPGFGSAFVAIATFFFAFTSLITYSYKAESSLAFFNSERKKVIKWPLIVLKIGFLIIVYYHSVNSAALACSFGDLGFGIMAWMNMLALIFLVKPVVVALKDYDAQRKKGIDPIFNPKKLGIKGADFWEEEYYHEIEKEVKSKKYVNSTMKTIKIQKVLSYTKNNIN
ncbi:alanine/glycine:cation symporter family protein [Staphylococcus sp. mip270_02]